MHEWDTEVIAGFQSVTGLLNKPEKTPHTLYGDDPLDVLAVVSHPQARCQ